MRKDHQLHPRPTAVQAEWSPATYGALVRFASKRLLPLLGKGAGLARAAPRSLPPPGAAGVLGGTPAEEARARFGLLQLFNEAVSTMFRFVFTGCALCPIAPIAPCTDCPNCPMHRLPIAPTLSLPRYTEPILTQVHRPDPNLTQVHRPDPNLTQVHRA